MRVYRPGRLFVWMLGAASLLSLFYCAIGVAALANVEGQPGEDWLDRAPPMVLMAGITSVFLYLWITLLTRRIIADGLWITFIGPIRKRSIHLRDVTRVRWWKNDAVTIYSAGRQQSHWFAPYRLEDAADLIKLIRNNVPATLQEGWHPFYQARMKGRYDRQQRFLMQNPRAKLTPQPIKVIRLLAISFAASFLVSLAFGVEIQWEFRGLENPPTAPLTGNWVLDCLLIGALANFPPLSLVFIELFRSRRKRAAESATGIEFV